MDIINVRQSLENITEQAAEIEELLNQIGEIDQNDIVFCERLHELFSDIGRTSVGAANDINLNTAIEMVMLEVNTW